MKVVTFITKVEFFVAVSECPTCYGLIQHAVVRHRAELGKLEKTALEFGKQPPIDQGGVDFVNELVALNETIKNLTELAKKHKGSPWLVFNFN